MKTISSVSGRLLRVVAASVPMAAVIVTASAAAAAASVEIEKSTNGEDADFGPGPSVVEGELVTWTWHVSTGSVELYDIVVADSSGAVPDCDITGDGVGDGTFIHPGPLEPGASFTCTATTTAAEPGETSVGYGEVRASDFDGTVFQDRDPSHYTTVALPSTSTTAPTTTSEQADESDPGLLSDSDVNLNSSLDLSSEQPTTATDRNQTSTTGADRSDPSTTTEGTNEASSAPEELALTAEGGRSFLPIGVGLVFIGVGLIFIGFRLEQLLGEPDEARLPVEQRRSGSDVLD